MDIESPEAVDILIRSIDSNSKALKDLVRIVHTLKEEHRILKERIDKIEKS